MLKNLIQNFLLAWKLPRWRWALLTAAVSDILGFGVALFPPILWVLDAITAVVLFAVLGFRWPLLPALAVEVVPGLQLFPAWTLVVAALASAEKAPQDVDGSQQDIQSLPAPQRKKKVLYSRQGGCPRNLYAKGNAR
jgi:fatty acid desaturase